MNLDERCLCHVTNTSFCAHFLFMTKYGRLSLFQTTLEHVSDFLEGYLKHIFRSSQCHAAACGLRGSASVRERPRHRDILNMSESPGPGHSGRTVSFSVLRSIKDESVIISAVSTHCQAGQTKKVRVRNVIPD